MYVDANEHEAELSSGGGQLDVDQVRRHPSTAKLKDARTRISPSFAFLRRKLPPSLLAIHYAVGTQLCNAPGLLNNLLLILQH